MLIYWAPALLIIFGMIVLGLVKHDNKILLAISVAWISMLAAGVLIYFLDCLILASPIGMQDLAIDVMAGTVIAVFFLPIVICIILYIRSIRKKNRNDAWGLLPVFVWIYVLIVTAIFGGDPCP